MQNSLPNGFVSVGEAIKLIESDTRSEAVVDTAFLVNNLPYLRVNGNYNIKLLKHQNGRVVNNGERYVYIANSYEKELLEHAITEHYKAMSGREFDLEKRVNALSTVVDEETNNISGRVVKNKNPMTKAGDNMANGVSQNVTE